MAAYSSENSQKNSKLTNSKTQKNVAMVLAVLLHLVILGSVMFITAPVLPLPKKPLEVKVWTESELRGGGSDHGGAPAVENKPKTGKLTQPMASLSSPTVKSPAIKPHPMEKTKVVRPSEPPQKPQPSSVPHENKVIPKSLPKPNTTQVSEKAKETPAAIALKKKSERIKRLEEEKTQMAHEQVRVKKRAQQTEERQAQRLKTQKEQQEAHAKREADKQALLAAQKTAMDKKQQQDIRAKREAQELAQQVAEKMQQEKIAKAEKDQKRLAQKKDEEAQKTRLRKLLAHGSSANTSDDDENRGHGGKAGQRGQSGGVGKSQGEGSEAGESPKIASRKATSGYASKVRRMVKPYIEFDNTDLDDNPRAIVVVYLEPSGDVIRKQLQKRSGNPDWDEAVMSAIAQAGRFPKDEDGIAPESVRITFSAMD